MTRVLHELHGRDGHRFSPYCWRAIMALKHKGLDFERAPMKFTDRSAIAPSGQDRVPVLVDGERWINDSWAIAEYLEDTYPDVPSLFGGAMGRAQAKFFNKWVDMSVHARLRALVVPDTFKHAHPDDSDWFRESRENMFSMKLEDMRGDVDGLKAELHATLAPLRATLETQPYLCGESPAYADYIFFGSRMWQRCASPLKLFDADDPIPPWRARLLAAFDGYAGEAPGYET